MSDWQPIETAREVRGWVLLRGGEPDDNWDGPAPPAVVAIWLHDDHCEEGWYFAAWDSAMRSTYLRPTHWMPLPAPPETT